MRKSGIRTSEFWLAVFASALTVLGAPTAGLPAIAYIIGRSILKAKGV